MDTSNGNNNGQNNESSSDTSITLPPNFIIRSYRPDEDDEGCQRLERTAPQWGPNANNNNDQKNKTKSNKKGSSEPSRRIKLIEKSFVVYPYHPYGVDARAKLSEEYEILVCVDTNNVGEKKVLGGSHTADDNSTDLSLSGGNIVGMIVCNIRHVSWYPSSRDVSDDGVVDGDGTSPSKNNTNRNNNKQPIRIKMGWLYDLRVDQSYQRQGIGRALSVELERRCLSRQVDVLRLTVNDNNYKAKAFYERLGYGFASKRAPLSTFLNGAVGRPLPKRNEWLLIRLVDTEICSSIMAHCCSSRGSGYDLCPMGQSGDGPSDAPVAADPSSSLSLSMEEGFQKLFGNTDLFEGLLLAVPRTDLSQRCRHLLDGDDGGSREEELITALEQSIVVSDHRHGALPNYGIIGMWNGSKLYNARILKVFGIPKAIWLSSLFHWSLYSVVGLVFSTWSMRLVRSFSGVGLPYILASSSSQQSLWRGRLDVLWLVLEALTFCFVAKMTWKAVSFFRFIIAREISHIRLRAFCPIAHGPRGKECLQAAIKASCTYSRQRGYITWLINIEDGHPLVDAFPMKSQFKTEFWQKWLLGPSPRMDDGEWEKLLEENNVCGDTKKTTESMDSSRMKQLRVAFNETDAFLDPRDH